MKKHIAIFAVIIILGSLAIFLPNFLSVNNKRKEDNKMKLKMEEHKINMNNISSNLDTIDNSYDNDKPIPEIYNKDQMFFDNIDILYNYFMFGEVEYIKQKIETYVHTHISKDILDCRIKDNTFKHNKNIITFELSMENVKSFVVSITLNNNDTNSGIVDITILHTI